MKQVRFSIITIVLNDLVGLRETKTSVDAQGFSDFEWIVVDGGSIDGTLEHLRRLDRPNCRWISEPDEGLYYAMNKGLDLAAGQYVVFMNSADRFAGSNVLARAAALVAQNEQQPDLIFGDAYEETASGELLLKSARSVGAIKRGMFTHHQAMVYSRRAIGDMRYDCRFRVAADYHFTCRLLARGARSLRVGFPICIFKRAGLSENHAEIGRRENLAVQKEVLRLGPIRRTGNYASYLASSLVRTNMRGLYDRIRFRQITPPHEIR
ncbi:MAG TPA: glycosyltransferase family 2 protein [Candidatus Dormibacteraeota bacterium]|nr:glycosyltransferase family 2 protein [Candidatus Dormibacteraeota bacterium]